jgi:arginine/lysine/ornithine decarboxylase
VYIASPDYLGFVSDIAELSRICHERKIPLLVDNAHGAYLAFTKPCAHPIALGADMCCDSAHKTLSVLTGGAYLHISKTAPSLLSEQSREAMQLFASTSPSYLVLQSLDYNNRYLSEGYAAHLNEFVNAVEGLKSALQSAGFTLVGDEPLKLTIATKDYGYKGFEVAEILQKKGIVCEFCDPDYICFMLSFENGLYSVEVLKDALCELEKRLKVLEEPPTVLKAQKSCSPKEALMCASEVLPIGKCEGRVMASISISCPPAIPIAVCGEVVDLEVIERMKYYGIEEIRVKI